MCMAEYIGHNKKVCWTLCLTTSLTRMRMGREPYWWNLEDSMKITKERHQLGSSWPIPMTVMWGGSQRVWGPDPWCNLTQPQDEISSRLSMSAFFQHTFTRWYPLESNFFLQRVAWSRLTNKKERELVGSNEGEGVRQFYTKPTTVQRCYMKSNPQLQCSSNIQHLQWYVKTTGNYSAKVLHETNSEALLHEKQQPSTKPTALW